MGLPCCDLPTSLPNVITDRLFANAKTPIQNILSAPENISRKICIDLFPDYYKLQTIKIPVIWVSNLDILLG